MRAGPGPLCSVDYRTCCISSYWGRMLYFAFCAYAFALACACLCVTLDPSGVAALNERHFMCKHAHLHCLTLTCKTHYPLSCSQLRRLWRLWRLRRNDDLESRSFHFPIFGSVRYSTLQRVGMLGVRTDHSTHPGVDVRILRLTCFTISLSVLTHTHTLTHTPPTQSRVC